MGLSRHPLGQKAGDTRLAEEYQDAAHWHRLQHQGYTIVPDVLGTELLQELLHCFFKTSPSEWKRLSGSHAR